MTNKSLFILLEKGMFMLCLYLCFFGSFFLNYDIKSSFEKNSDKQSQVIMKEIQRQAAQRNLEALAICNDNKKRHKNIGISEEQHQAMITEMQRQARGHYPQAFLPQPKLMNIVNLTSFIIRITDQAHQWLQIEGQQEQPFIGADLYPDKHLPVKAFVYTQEPLLRYCFQLIKKNHDSRYKACKPFSCVMRANEDLDKQNIQATFEDIKTGSDKMIKSTTVPKDSPYFNMIFYTNPKTSKINFRLQHCCK